MDDDFTYVPTWSGTVYVAFVIDVFARRIVALRDLHANPFRVTAWRTSTSMKTQFVLDALEQAIRQRKTPDNKDLVQHSDRPSHGLKTNRCRATGSQYLSIKYTERLTPSRAIAAQYPAGQPKAGIDLSVGTVGDANPSHACKHALPGNGQCSGRVRHRPVPNRSPSRRLKTIACQATHQPNRPVEIDTRSRMGNAEPQLRAAKWVDRYNNVRGSPGPMAFTPSPFSTPPDTSPAQKQRRPSMQT